MYRVARDRAGLTRDDAAERVNVAARTLYDYEVGNNVPPPEVVTAMADAYGAPWLPHWYCRHECAVGLRYGFEFLNNIDRNPVVGIAKVRREAIEMLPALDRLEDLLTNKSSRQQLSDTEVSRVESDLDQVLDTGHAIQELVVDLAVLIDTVRAIRAHNAKCERRGYVTHSRERDEFMARLVEVAR